MIQAQIPAETGSGAPSLAAPTALVPGINPAFLRDRLVVPLGADGDVMRWGMADPEDRALLDALRFASCGPIAAVRLPGAMLRALLGTAPALGEGDTASLTSYTRIPHADAVIRLRSHLVAAISSSADRVAIQASGDLLVQKAGLEIARSDVGTVEAEALIAAAVALTATPEHGDTPGVRVVDLGGNMRFTIEPLPTGVALLLAPTGPR